MNNGHVTEMSTGQFADYCNRLTGSHKTSASVARDCRNGVLNAYRNDGGQWRVVVTEPVVAMSEYIELLDKYQQIQERINTILGLLKKERDR